MLFGCQRCDTYPKNPEDGHFEVYLSKHLRFERKYLKLEDLRRNNSAQILSFEEWVHACGIGDHWVAMCVHYTGTYINNFGI